MNCSTMVRAFNKIGLTERDPKDSKGSMGDTRGAIGIVGSLGKLKLVCFSKMLVENVAFRIPFESIWFQHIEGK